MSPTPAIAPERPASAWVQRWAHLVPAGGAVLDVACGEGRHLRFFQSLGHPVTGVDRNPDALAVARAQAPGAELVQADIENGPWPFNGPDTPRTFAGVIVTNYLWRPLLRTIIDSVARAPEPEGNGVLLYETFALGNEQFGKPSNPDFLLRPGELLAACANARTPLRIVAYEDLTLDDPPRRVQRVAAVRV